MEQWLIEYKLSIRTLSILVDIKPRMLNEIVKKVRSPMQQTIKKILNVIDNINPIPGKRIIDTPEIVTGRLEFMLFQLGVVESHSHTSGPYVYDKTRSIEDFGLEYISLENIHSVKNNRHILCRLRSGRVILTEAFLSRIGYNLGDEFDDDVVSEVIKFLETFKQKCVYCKFTQFSFFIQHNFHDDHFCNAKCKVEYEEIYGPYVP